MSDQSISRRLLSLTRGVRGRIALAALLGILATAAGVARLTVQGVALAQLFGGASFADVVPALLTILALPLVRVACTTGKELVGYGTAAIVKVRLRTTIYAHLLDLGPGFMGGRRTGDILVTAVESVEQLDTYFGRYVPQLVVATVAPFAIFGVMIWIDRDSAFIFLGAALLALLAPRAFRRSTAGASAGRRQAYAQLAADFLDGIQGLPTLKAFGQSRQWGDELAVRSVALFRATMSVLALNIAEGSVANLSMVTGAAATLVWGAIRVADGRLDVAPLMIVLFLGVEVFRPLRELNQLHHQSLLAIAAASGIFTLLDRRPSVAEPNAPTATEATPIEPTITLDNVHFGYPRPDGTPPRSYALRGVSVSVPVGGSLALVGPSGAGKSTVVALLLRLFDPQNGIVRVGGHDVRTLPRDFLRRQIALVSQDTYLFHGTVAENLRVARAEATDAELQHACEASGAQEFIDNLPSRYHTIIGERGLRLSGGQRQRLAIARALLKDAPILILDEATSHVDAENESLIQTAIARAMRNRTTIVIAHRLSTVAHCDQVVVLDRGVVAEAGTPTELRARDGLFASLIAAQDLDTEAHSPLPLAGAELGVAPGMGAGVNRHEVDVDDMIRPTDAGAGYLPLPPSGEGLGVAPGAATTDLGAIETGRRLLRLVQPQWVRLAITLASGVAAAAASVALGMASGLLAGLAGSGISVRATEVGTVGASEITDSLRIAVPLLAVLAGGFTWFESWISHDMAYRLLSDMRIALYRALDRLGPAYLLGRRTGDLTSLMTGDIETVESFFAHAIAQAFVAVMVPGVALTILALHSWPLALALVPFLLLVGFSPSLIGRQTERLGNRLRAQTGLVNALVSDSVQGLRETVAFGYGRRRLAEIDQQSRSLTALCVQYGRQLGFQSGAVEGLQAFGGLTVLSFGGWLATQGEVRAADLPLLTMLAFTCFGPIATISAVAKELEGAFGSGRRLFAVHDAPVRVTDRPDATDPQEDVSTSMAITFDQVTFAYEPGLAPALDRVSFRVAPGETVAIVGQSGAGKSTVAHLALRFWDPQSGVIRLGNDDIRHRTLDGLRSRIAFVSQDIYLFSRSVRENLRLANRNATDAEIEEACRQARAHEFIATMPDGYDTPVDERGGSLSGGQRQRLALARALLKNAPVLILDEATSHLDAANERAVRDALTAARSGRTTLIIAHRLSTVRDADRIVVLDAGRVAEVGHHDELIARGGVYAQLVRAQLRQEAHASRVREVATLR